MREFIFKSEETALMFKKYIEKKFNASVDVVDTHAFITIKDKYNVVGVVKSGIQYYTDVKVDLICSECGRPLKNGLIIFDGEYKLIGSQCYKKQFNNINEILSKFTEIVNFYAMIEKGKVKKTKDILKVAYKSVQERGFFNKSNPLGEESTAENVIRRIYECSSIEDIDITPYVNALDDSEFSNNIRTLLSFEFTPKSQIPILVCLFNKMFLPKQPKIDLELSKMYSFKISKVFRCNSLYKFITNDNLILTAFSEKKFMQAKEIRCKIKKIYDYKGELQVIVNYIKELNV